ncbi:MAG: hypothetical protein HY689_10355 [Chloroflexi bacterium]|nr:hypothetical protein [Chloroflexota bacterium]
MFRLSGGRPSQLAATQAGQTPLVALGILAACIGTQPFGTVWIGFLASRAGAPVATAADALVALALMVPVARLVLR